jgi:NTF2 fold immunity protein
MKSWLLLLLLCWLGSIASGAAQGYRNGRLVLGREFAEKHLRTAMADSVRQKTVAKRWRLPVAALPDTATALRAIEPLLFRVYNKKSIEWQRPYEIYHIEKYWVISGTLPFGYAGGIFMVVVDASNSRVLELIHGQ